MFPISSLVGELEHSLLIVEGKHDEQALRSLGLSHIIPINGQPLFHLIEPIQTLQEQIRELDVVVLTDFDRTGNKLAHKLESLLTMYKIRPNNRLRAFVRGFGFGKIEELKSLTKGFKDISLAHIKAPRPKR